MTQRILLSAFACDPFFGSDEEVGWQWAVQLERRGLDVTVLTRRSHQAAIERQVAAGGACRGVRFVYVDLPRLHGLLRRINRRNQLYYYAWQWAAWRRAEALQAELPFDLVHHVTWVSFRQPSFMGRLGIPFVFGPVAGADEIPPGYDARFSWRQRLIERARRLLNQWVRWDPLMRQTYRQAQRVVFTSPAHLARVPAFVREKSVVELAIGVDVAALTAAGVDAAALPAAGVDVRSGDGSGPRAVADDATRLIFVGRAIGWKGLDIGLEIFARALALRPGLRLTVVGDGPDRARWQARAAQLGVASALDWTGWLPKTEVQALYARHDLLFNPSLRDSGGFVVLEALGCGLPVACFRLGGPGVIVDDSVGAAVEALPDIGQTVELFATRLLQLLDRVRDDPNLAAACRARAARFTWQALCDRVLDGLIAPEVRG